MRRKQRKTDTGSLDERVEVQSKTEVLDDSGAVTSSWSTLGTVWAEVLPVRGQERAIADKKRGVQTYRLTVRNSGTGGKISTDCKLLWRGVELNVTTSPDAGRSAYLEFEAEKGVPTV